MATATSEIVAPVAPVEVVAPANPLLSMTAETQEAFQKAYNEQEANGRSWAFACDLYIGSHVDADGFLPSSFHGSQGTKDDKLLCETIATDVKTFIGAKCAPGNEKVGITRVSQVFSSLIMKSRSDEWGIEGYLEVHPAKTPTPANKGGKLKVNREVLAQALAKPDWKYKASNPPKKAATDSVTAGAIKGAETVKRLTNIAKSIPETGMIHADVVNKNGGKSKVKSALPADNQNDIIGQCVILLNRLCTEALSEHGKALALQATTPKAE